MIGKELGQYHIVEALGEGGMASVYKGYDRKLDRDVAIKVILKGFTYSGEFLKRFEREARSVARLTHTNIVNVINYGSDEGIPYLVMEFVSGGTLKEKLGKPIPWQQVAQMLTPVARALEYAHGKKIIHRDIKPANFLITQSGDLMISDFGIAKALDEDLTKLTATGVGIGTPAYMAPEQGLGKEVDHRADIYSLGIVFYEMITGRTPYKADTPLAVLMRHVNDPLPRPRKFVPDLPEEVEKVMFMALAKDPEHRYQSMIDFAETLENLVLQQKELEIPKDPFQTIPSVSQQREKGEENQVRVAQFLKEGEEAVKHKDWESAHVNYRKVLSLQPDHTAALAGLRKALQGQELTLLYGQALFHQEAGRPEKALRLLKQIQDSDADYEDIADRIISIEALLVDWEKETPVSEKTAKHRVSPKKSTASFFQTLPRWVLLGAGGLSLVVVVALIFWGGNALLNSLSQTPSPPDTSTLNPSINPSNTPEGLPTSFIDEKGVPMENVSAGPFAMGSEDEIPIHIVELDNFYIDRYEVTNARYEECVKEEVCDPPYLTSSYTQDSYYGNTKYADYPVIYVSWESAQTYCQWRNARLPTEAEWEKAARGSLERRKYPWGNTIDGTLANFCDVNCSFDHRNIDFDDQYDDTAPVGSYEPNRYNLYDMTGNVGEWVADWYGPEYYSTSPSRNPEGPEDGDSRVLRGGSWISGVSNLPVANRNFFNPENQYYYVGFRCARD